MRTSAVILLLLAIIWSCSSATRQAQDESEPKTTIRVDNRNTLDMTIYALRNSHRVRLGIVSSLSTKVLTIPDHLVRGTLSLRFLADPVGSARTPISEQLTVIPGDQVEMIIN
ncbi:hypothetical protein GWO43_02470 [candidate division KSB1 bacterium]|nr:hypothetical protein [candidate division KSB1 bacterium]NIR69730.1 hypothetical protein [candidate division KSB1 bacterium]NIS22918.1 hypothetical protein [candidate division KSB1 bacterium]NIT69775.1 hypothetical protein [candidate division KSB1 bacterium]NIU23449.1 hypothetical protein [candidate division KSB1 bacterium]